MTDLSVNTFKSKLVGGGARNNLFKVLVNFPSYANGHTELTSFFAKGAKFPASTTTAIDVPFRGRQIPVEGDRTYDPVSLLIINDVTHPIRESFIRWKNEMSEHSGNRGLSNPSDYYADVIIEQLDKAGNTTVTNKLVGAWPLTISEIDLNWETNNTIEEFTVELRYLYWEQDGITR